MGPEWSHAEANRTIDEVKRRSLIDREFRELALANAAKAIAKINPKSLPAGLSVKFVEPGVGTAADQPGVLVVELPAAIEPEEIDQLTSEELDQAVGGSGDIRFPNRWTPPEES
jgi:hypothetical protein